jgi:hypothetical protein
MAQLYRKHRQLRVIFIATKQKPSCEILSISQCTMEIYFSCLKTLHILQNHPRQLFKKKMSQIFLSRCLVVK